MFSVFKAGVQNELNAFFAHLANQADLVREVSAQAFSKARRQFSHRAFTRLNEHFLRLVTGEVTVPRWHGLRVVAADASKMRLFLSDACRRCTREVIAFALYLPGLEMTLASSLYAPDVGERQMLFEHLEALAPDDLLVLDRGYPARWLIAYLTQQGIRFCLRVDQAGFSVRVENSDIATLVDAYVMPLVNSPRWKNKAKSWRDIGDISMRTSRPK